jgi:hypothetical protein
MLPHLTSLHMNKRPCIIFPNLPPGQSKITFQYKAMLLFSRDYKSLPFLLNASFRNHLFPSSLELCHASNLSFTVMNNTQHPWLGRCGIVPVNSVLAVQVLQSFEYLASVCADYHFIKSFKLLQDGLKRSHFY